MAAVGGAGGLGRRAAARRRPYCCSVAAGALRARSGSGRARWAWCAPAATSGRQALVVVGDGLLLGLRCRWRPEPDLSGLDLDAGISVALLLPGPVCRLFAPAPSGLPCVGSLVMGPELRMSGRRPWRWETWCSWAEFMARVRSVLHGHVGDVVARVRP